MELEEGVSGKHDANVSLRSHVLILTYMAWLLTAKPSATGPSSCLSDGAAQANLGQNSQKGERGKTQAVEGDSWRVCCWLIGEEGARSGPNIWSSLGETP